ncbi:MAG TPA: M42 family metallopeptidase, partial [Chloroflexi bacterium]|nr:M42 family metallopeptidase [Chloroflexota bacterium]
FEKGFIRFTNVGGVDVRTILGQEVLVHGRRPLIGIIGSHPPHVTPPEERNKPIPMDKLFIDVGLTEERLHQEVRVGDMITMRRDFLSLAEGYVSGKSFDDRAGVVSLALCLEMLAGMRHEWDVYAVATSQEEVGLRGAQVSAYGIAPDIAIAVDVGFGAQQGVSENESIAMDGGPAIAMGPNIHPAMYERLVAIARDHELKYQTEVAAGATGTDAWAIQVARSGIPCGLLSIPLRYMHTSVETICIRDIERTARLMALFIAGLDENFASALPL